MFEAHFAGLITFVHFKMNELSDIISAVWIGREVWSGKGLQVQEPMDCCSSFLFTSCDFRVHYSSALVGSLPCARRQ
jgi:hypothetical protein